MLITEYYKEQNRALHASKKKFGHRGHKHIPKIKSLMNRFGCETVLDYGAGQGDLEKHADFSVHSYDPAVSEFESDPPACDLVVSTDVFEHIEPELLDNVLAHIKDKMNKAGYFVINTREDRTKTLPDGTNPHLITEGLGWWRKRLTRYFKIEKINQCGHHIFAICHKL